MGARRSAAKDHEPRTPAPGGTPWKGRLRSHHVTPQCVPTQRLASQPMNWDEAEEVQTSNKRSAPKALKKGCNAGAAHLSKTALPQFPQLTGNDPEHPIIIDEECERGNSQLVLKPLRRSPRFHQKNNNSGKQECKPGNNQLAIKPVHRSPRFHQKNNYSGKQECEPGNNQLAIKPLRRSPRFLQGDNNSGKQLLPLNPGEFSCNQKTEKVLRKDKSQASLKNNKENTRVKSQKEPLEPCQVSHDVLGNKIADVSHKKRGKQDVESRHCEVMTGKRKRGTKGKSPSKKKGCQDPKSSPSDCQEITPRKSIDRNIKKGPIVRHPKMHKVASEVERARGGSDDWTEEQDMALRNAYFTARPSPHFWKKVSKMVPGRSAEECFNRIHADLSTPTPIASRPRTSKTFSPVAKFTLSDSKLPNILEHTVLRQKTTKQKNLAAQKTVRHLLQKHCLIDQAQEADHFSLFETSPGATQLNISLEDSPGTPDSYRNSGTLNKCSGSSFARKKPLSRLRTMQAEPSPAVLKPLKNIVLHERYINQLYRRDGSKTVRKRTPASKGAESKKYFSMKQASSLRAAKNALITEATDFIGQFKKLQANSHAYIVENNENDCIESDSSDDKE